VLIYKELIGRDKKKKYMKLHWRKKDNDGYGQKRVKGIEDMTNREQRSIRKKWRETKAEYRRREKIMSLLETEST
jgi:uncharacterized protein with WD repeat